MGREGQVLTALRAGGPGAEVGGQPLRGGRHTRNSRPQSQLRIDEHRSVTNGGPEPTPDEVLAALDSAGHLTLVVASHQVFACVGADVHSRGRLRT